MQKNISSSRCIQTGFLLSGQKVKCSGCGLNYLRQLFQLHKLLKERCSIFESSSIHENS